MQQVKHLKHLKRRRRARDPAPSRWAYRFQRLWLTPHLRGVLRKGLPVFSILLVAGWYLADAGRMEKIRQTMSDVRNSVAEQPEFMVRLMRIENASPELAADIREILPLDLPMSSFDLELDHMRAQVAGLDAVASVRLRVVSGGVLAVRVVERLPAVIWRRADGLELLDAGGHRVGPLAERALRPDLAVIAGEGADAAVVEALALIEAAAPLADRLRGLTRVGERRWDVVLDRDQRILLPADDPVPAFERVMALDSVQDVLARDVTVVDMRDAARPTLRLTAEAMQELYRLRDVAVAERDDDA